MEQKVQKKKTKIFFCIPKNPRLGFQPLAQASCRRVFAVPILPGLTRRIGPRFPQKSSRRFTMQALDKDLETELQLDEWFEAPTHEAAVEMMQADAVVPFGTAMWPL
jgi:hypothetical protein